MIVLEWLTFIWPWYLLTVLFESPWILFGIRGHSFKSRLFWAFALTAFTYPFVTALFPRLIVDPTTFVVVAELFAALGEAALFTLCADRRASTEQRRWNAFVVIAANLFSYVVGEVLKHLQVL